MVFEAEVKAAADHWARFYALPGLTPALIHGVIQQETGHRIAPVITREPDGDYSYGPMQVKGDTVRTVLKLTFPAADLATHPNLGIWYGVKEFGRRMKALGGDPIKAISAWNAGLGGVGRNPDYVAKVVGFWKQYGGQAASAVLPLVALAGLAFWIVSRRRRAA